MKESIIILIIVFSAVLLPKFVLNKYENESNTFNYNENKMHYSFSSITENNDINLDSIKNVNYLSKIIKAEVTPLKVKVGDNQTMTVNITSLYPIKSVRAFVETDLGFERYNLSLINGGFNKGIWFAYWIVHGTSSRNYTTTFVAIDIRNQSSTINVTWSDPCNVPAGGDFYVEDDCSYSSDNGADNGDVILGRPTPITLTITGGTFAWNSGKEIRISKGNKIVINGGKIVQTNLWMIDADDDTYPGEGLTQYAQGSAPTDGRRRNTLASITAEDCDDTNFQIYPGATDVCDDAMDYNCDGYDYTLWYQDIDMDGYGSGTTTVSCNDPGDTWVSSDGDCDDATTALNPGAVEVCDDGIDQDCDGNMDCADAACWTNAAC